MPHPYSILNMLPCIIIITVSLAMIKKKKKKKNHQDGPLAVTFALFYILYTCRTPNTSIFTVVTIVDTQPSVRTVNKSRLTSSTVEIIQYNLTSAIDNPAPSQGSGTCREGLPAWPVLIRCPPWMTWTQPYQDGVDSKLNLPVLRNPSCLHTTFASLVDHKSSQTVPQALL